METIKLTPENRRDFYRQCKENIDYYLNTVREDDYEFIYKLVGPPMYKFVNFTGTDCKELLNELRLYFANKMKELS